MYTRCIFGYFLSSDLIRINGLLIYSFWPTLWGQHQYKKQTKTSGIKFLSKAVWERALKYIVTKKQFYQNLENGKKNEYMKLGLLWLKPGGNSEGNKNIEMCWSLHLMGTEDFFPLPSNQTFRFSLYVWANIKKIPACPSLWQAVFGGLWLLLYLSNLQAVLHDTLLLLTTAQTGGV